MSVTISQSISSVPEVWKEYNKQKPDTDLKILEIVPESIPIQGKKNTNLLFH